MGEPRVVDFSSAPPNQKPLLGIPAGARRCNGKSPMCRMGTPRLLRSWVKRLIAKVNERLKSINYPVYNVYCIYLDAMIC